MNACVCAFMCVCAGVDRITVGTQGTYTVSCKPRNLISKNRKIQLSLFISSLQMFVFRLTFSSHSGRHTAPHRQLTCRGLEHQWAQHIWNQASLPWPDRIRDVAKLTPRKCLKSSKSAPTRCDPWSTDPSLSPYSISFRNAMAESSHLPDAIFQRN